MSTGRTRVLLVHSFEGTAKRARERRLAANLTLQTRYEFEHMCICTRDEYYSGSSLFDVGGMRRRLFEHVSLFKPEFVLLHYGGAVSKHGETVLSALEGLRDCFDVQIAFESNWLSEQLLQDARCKWLTTASLEARRLADDVFRFDRSEFRVPF